MNIHIFNVENQYAFSYLKFIESNFDVAGELIVFRKRAAHRFDYSDILRGKIVYTRNNFDFFKALGPELRKSRRIIFHQLPHGPALIMWNLFPRLFRKVTWIIWGGDVYIHRQSGESLPNRFYEIFRKKLIERIPRIASFVPGDFEIIRKTYGTEAEYFQSMYPLPVDFLHYAGTAALETGEIKILAGNSGNPSNLHNEIFAKLEPLKDSSIRIYCPLSYSGRPDYIKSVEANGKSIFGDKFIPMHEMIDPGRYLDLLYEIDIAIMNHDRQQGLGNILPLLYFGKKVFMRSGTTSFDYLKSMGCHLYDISSIVTFDESLLKAEREIFEENRRIIGDLLSEKRCRELWERILK